MVAGRSNLKGALDLLLSLDLGEIGAAKGSCAGLPAGGGGDEFLPGEMLYQLIHIPDGIDG